MFDTRGLEILGESLYNNSANCIEGGGSLDYIYRIRSTEVGLLNLTVVGEVDSSYPQECGPEFIVHKRCPINTDIYPFEKRFFGFRDAVSKLLLVEPEGFPVEVVKSALLCSNGQPLIKLHPQMLTSPVSRYHHAEHNVDFRIALHRRRPRH